MKTRSLVAVLTLVPGLLAAQDEPPPKEVPLQDLVPAQLAEVELARSRACVPALARLAELDRDLQPLVGRAARLQELDRAVRLEDSTEVAPFDGNDPLEATVRDWFVSDGELGRQWAESQDTAIARQRDEARAEIRARIGEALEELGARGQGRLSEAGDLQAAVAPCDGAILVRGAVLEVCDTVESPICAAAADTATPDTLAPATLRFVDAPEDLWDVEEFRPWTDPTPLRVLPSGELAGSRTAARSRLGNQVVVVAVTPILRDRSTLTPEQVAEFEDNLDSLGFTFEHPELVFAPAVELQLNAAGPLGGETHYMLHFGDLSDPPSQVIWSAPVGTGGPVQAILPAAPEALERMARGEGLSLTALALEEAPEEEIRGDVVYSVNVPTLYQDRAVTAVLEYMGGGQLAQDLGRLVRADTASGGGGLDRSPRRP